MEKATRTNQNGNCAHIVITVHGIQTFGQWQARLEDLLHERDPNIKIYNFEFGYFSLFAFFLPFLRWLVVRKFQRWLQQESRRFPSGARVDIVAHSFGTHLVGWGLHGLLKVGAPKIHTIIFASSVLKASFPWGSLFDAQVVKRVVNECGTRDKVLVFNQMMVLFTGMAGRVGFNGGINENFRNRYFDFGHSGYYRDKSGSYYDNFMKEKWLPLLLTDSPICRYDQRKRTPFQWAVSTLLLNSEPLKISCWTLVLCIPLLSFYNLWKTAEAAQQKEQEQRKTAEKNLYESLLDESRALRQAEEVGYLEKVEDRLRYALSLYPQETTRVRRELVAGLGNLRSKAPIEWGEFTQDILVVASSTQTNEVALGLADGSLSIRELPSGLEVASFEENRASLVGLDFADQGKKLLSAYRDGRILIYEKRDLIDWVISRKFQTKEKIEYASLSADGEQIALYPVNKRYFLLGSMRTGRFERRRLPYGGRTVWEHRYVSRSPLPRRLSFDPKNRYLAVGYQQRDRFRVGIWDLRQNKFVILLPSDLGYVHSVNFSRYGDHVAVGAEEGMRVFNTKGFRRGKRMVGDVVTSVDLECDRFVAFTSPQREVVRLQTPLTRGKVTDLPHAGVHSVMFAYRRHHLVTASRRLVKVWDTFGEERTVLMGHGRGVPGLTYHLQSGYLGSASKDRSIRLWNRDTEIGSQRIEFKEQVQALSFHPRLHRAGIGTWSGRVYEADLISGEQKLINDDFSQVWWVGYSRDGEHFAASGRPKRKKGVGLVTWNVHRGKINRRSKKVLSAHYVKSFAFASNGKTLLWPAPSRRLHAWHLDGQKSVLPPAARVAGTTHAVVGMQQAGFAFVDSIGRPTLWASDSPDKLNHFPLSERTQRFRSGSMVSVNSDGKLLAAASASTVSLWDIPSQKFLFEFPSEPSTVWSLAWSPKGNTLSVGTSNGEIVQWHVDRVRRHLQRLNLDW